MDSVAWITTAVCLLAILNSSIAQDSPQLDSDSYFTLLNQNRKDNDLLLTVSCTYSGNIMYEIVNTQFLSVNSTSGEIRLTVDAFGLEIQNYTMVLRCVDANDENILDLSLLTVARVDENEFSPQFLHNTLQVDVSESRDYTTSPFVVQVNATDSDLGTFGTIEYGILGETDNSFTVDSSSGIVSLQSSLDRESRDEYVFIVTASNPPVPESGLVRSADVLVTVQVTNVNDESPVFTESNYQVTVHETWVEGGFFRPSPGFFVIQCTDDDTDQADITYAISISPDSDPGPFVLDAASGSLSVTEDLDYETRISYSFAVACSDNGSPNFTDSARVDITVSSVNEFPPVADISPSTRTLFESNVGTVVLSVEAGDYLITDEDAGPDGEITYTLDETTVGADYFSVDLMTGAVIVEQELDLDNSSSSLLFLRITITGCDTHPPRDVCPNIQVLFIVRESNDNPPLFSQHVYNVSLSEISPIDSTVVVASCTDADRTVGTFSSIQFVSPSEDVTNTFHLDSTTGVVVTATSLDYEMLQSYVFELQCSDSGGSTDDATVQVDILPENDIPPQFDRSIYEFQISRTTPSNRYPIGTVVASDQDVDVGAQLDYAIEANPFFDITSFGVIELIAPILDYPDANLSLTVETTDGLNSSSAEVIIYLTAGNLDQPEFIVGSRTLQISELLPPGTNIHNVLCSDTDSGANGDITYSITLGNTGWLFAIDSLTGTITIANSLVLPQNISEEVYQLEVQCQDNGTPVLSDSAVVLVRVYQDDSSPPEIANETITAFVGEDASINDVVITIQASDLDTEILRFHLENESIPGAFLIDPSSGTVFVAAALDREAISMYEMTVVVTEVQDPSNPSPERSDSANLAIFVRDINDNSPTCDSSTLSTTVQDNLDPGSPILQLNCYDPDSDENGQIQYSLSNDFGVLNISSQGEISLANHLNATELNILISTVTVADQGISPRSRSYQITIFISLTNRYTPTFTNLPATIQLSEATPIHETVFSVGATDPDRGSFGEVRYEIVNSEENEPFTIFPNTGGIILTQKLNFFEQQVYTLNISASDSDFTVIEALTVEVLDANEFVPECVSTFVTASIPEGLTAPQLLSSGLSCSDDDEGSNGEIVFSILSGNHGDAFEVLSDGSIRTQVTLDFEDIDRYELQIHVSDSGSTPFSLNASVVILVQPVNEYTPAFESDAFNANVHENSEIGTTILQISAFDQDASTTPDGQVDLALLELEEPVFSISRTGLLQVSGNLDREQNDFYRFIVQASDQGQPLRTNTTTIEITIIDEDDNAPEFSQALYVSTLSQTAGVGSSVVTVNCFDPDLGTNAAIAYSIDGSADAQFFEIQQFSGEIQLAENFSTSQTYTFTVSCTGPGPANFSDTAVVSIQVLVDTNITFHPSSSYNETLREDLSPVFTVLLVNATSSTGATLTYTLLNEGTPFSIDVTSGSLRLIASLDYEAMRSYSLDIQASDNGEPPNIGLALVQILVENVNDGEPQITTSSNATITLPEGLTVTPIIIESYECTDSDDGILGQVTFSIQAGNPDGVFTVSGDGTLQLTGELDYETAQSYSLLLVCEDGGNPARTDSITVPITVTPINDNAPQFVVNSPQFSLSEDLPLTTLTGLSIQAEDADLAPHNDIRYSIISGNDNPQTFAISPTTGQLTLIHTLDYETTTTHTLVISAEDSGGQVNPDFVVFSDTVTVIINVIDVNDNHPQFSQQIYTGEIRETASVDDQVILQPPIVCTDRDSGVNGETSLYIIDGNTNIFTIQNSDIIIIQEDPQFEFERAHQLTLECRDNGFPQLASQATVIISVTDVSEFGPEFNQTLYRLQVNETAPVGSEIGMVVATDQDIGDDESLVYSFTNTTSLPFAVDSSSGNISLLASLDYETQDRLYILEVTATDSAGLSSFTTVLVEVLNDNDNFPFFTQTNYVTSVSEHAVLGTFVNQATCSDVDDQADGIPVQYALTEMGTPFTVDTLTGIVTVAAELDLELVQRYSLQIACTDSGGSNAIAVLTIHLEPFNDFPPVFTGDLPYSIEITENLPLGLPIFRAIANDSDAIEYNDITFSFLSGNEAGSFEIDLTTGVIAVNQSIDREEQLSYALEIMAENVIPAGDTSGSLPLSSTTSIAITVLDLNDNDPTVIPSEVTVFLSESNSSNVEIATLVCFDVDSAENGTIDFSITSENTADSFQIFDNGSLVITDFISADSVVEVTCSDGGTPQRSTTAVVIVRMITTNDHAPMFPMGSYVINVLGSQPIGIDVQCFTAVDRDGAGMPEGSVTYLIQPQSLGSDVSRFSIREDTGCVFVSIALEFDVQNLYQYTIIATDGGDPPLSSNATLIIEVVDTVRDPPVFTDASYTRIVSEGVASETFIAATECSDPDENDTVSYSITTGDPTGIFSIDNTTGTVRVAPGQRLDYETATSHILVVLCTDSYDLSDSASVFVTVTAMNEFTPAFQARMVIVPEHSIGGTLVTQLEWTDNDAGPDGEVSFNITHGNTGNAFLITDDGRILVRGDLDRESLDFYNLEIRISDLTEDLDERRSSMNNISVTIADINDHAPVFDSDPYVFGPLEGNEPLEYYVGAVTCTDNDIGSNAQVGYHIAEGIGGSSFFTVHSECGNITVNGDLETRAVDNTTFFIECTDAGSLQLTSSAVVIVSVIEVNRNAPEFENSSYFLMFPEETPFAELLFSVHAEDSDAGGSGQVQYLLQDDFDGLFIIGESSGDFSISRPLDFEAEGEYLLIIEAVDRPQNISTQMTATANVTIVVIPVNEYAPICPNLVYHTVVNETIQGEILQLDCSDDDGGADGILQYSISGSVGTELFTVTPDGELIVPSIIMPNASIEEYSLTISISDTGLTPQFVEVTVVVAYSFDDLGPPVFNASLYQFSISELAPVGYIIGVVMATDDDPGLQGRVTYSLSGTEKFQVDLFTGALFVSQQLDYEARLFEEFVIVAQDSDPFSPLSSSAVVNVTVLNEDDNSPQCDLTFSVAEVMSDSQFGDTVVSVSCLDPDGGQLMFELVSGGKRQASSFDIEPTTGQIFVTGPLTPSSTTVLTVRVSDEGGQITEVTVSIQVMFANVEPPVFPQDEYTLSVAEDTPLLSIIGSVPATDADSNSLDLQYSIVNADQTPQFYINPNTADILLTVPLDHETRQQYSFTVMVQDRGSYNGSNQLSDTAVVVISVLNTNDNFPILDGGGVYGATISQDTEFGTEILRISCTDSDTAPFSLPDISGSGFSDTPFELAIPENITSSTDGSGEFNDPSTSASGSGTISFIVEYTIITSDRLLVSRAYFFNITCTDEGGLSTEGEVIVFVSESAAPTFSQPAYTWVLGESASVYSEYTEIEATSNDGSGVSYAITDGNEDGVFYINPDSGVVRLVSSLDYERQRTHRLVIRATDGVNRQSSVLLIVEVLDENDEVPLTPPSAVLQLSQNSPVGHPVGTLECSDGDSNPNAMFNFTFIPASDLFIVDEYGVVRLEGVLDDTPVYALQVTCSDISKPGFATTGIVTIETTPFNQYQPEFELDTYTFSIREDTEVLSLVGAVQASDRDVGSYGELSYAITEGNPNKFYIQAATGRIGLLTSLDRESVESYLITVAATDGGLSAPDPTRMTGTTVVSILVEDTNDIAPMLNQSLYVQAITVNHPLLDPVLTAECTDSDSPDVTFSLSPNSEHFAVQASGAIILTKEQTEPALYNFSVVCTDTVLSSSAMVIVIVDSAELFVPEFDTAYYSTSISEDAPVFSTVLQVHATVADANANIEYSIEEESLRDLFYIDPTSGEIIILNPLDSNQQSLYILTVRATNLRFATRYSVAIVEIEVNGTESSPPSFTTPFFLSRINEGAQLLTPVLQVQCTETDTNADFAYAITSGLTSPAFSITSAGLIVVSGEIDFESETVHTLEVTCSNSEDSLRTAIATVRIEILPTNEFVPAFSESEYQFTVEEDSFGTLIGRVEAVDNDGGSQGEVSYHLQDPSDLSVVLLEPSTGDIFIANNLDYETQSVWRLPLIARDGGGKESYANLEISISNINDEYPVVSPSAASATITEDTSVGYPILSYVCYDPDGTDTALSITDGNSLGYFSLNEFNQLIWIGSSGDVSTDVISLTLQCEDTEAPDQTTLAHAVITVQGTEGGSPPQFSEGTYNTSIAESAQIGSSVLSVIATGSSLTVVYNVESVPSDFPFSINSTTGIIYLDSALNFEMTPLYIFSVRATDSLSGASSAALVTVSVEDSNDIRPQIFPLVHTVVLSEDFPLAASVATFACIDGDLGSNGETGFQLSSGNEDGVFSISGGGNVELASSLDFETTSSYNITVLCIDTGDTPLSASATLLVEVTGINEYPPQFANDSYNFTVAEDVGAGDVVGTVSASDRDAGLDGDVRYEIVGGSGVGFFSVNSGGEIRTTTQSLNATAQPTLGLVVRAADRGGLSEDVPVTVIISDINEPPVFSSDSYVAITSTDQPAGTSILDLVCFDTDLGDNALLSLAINSNPSNLDVNLQLEGSTGAITASIVLVSPLVAGSYEIILRCSDMGDSPLHTDASVTVRVEGLNTPPVFSHGSISISVPENTATGTSLTTVNATDAETGVMYQITGGNGQGTFTINAANGDISLFLPLDYETTSTYTITVMASDLSPSNSRSASAEVMVFVTNTNDITPTLNPSVLEVITLSENTEPVSDVRTYSCSDPDGGEVTFSVAPLLGVTSPFSLSQISDSTATLQLREPIDFEQQSVYTLTITCIDTPIQSGDTSLQSSSTVTIYVTPENNHSPEFVSPALFEVREDTPIGEVIAGVEAIDRDNRSTSLITYFSSSHNDVFHVDQRSGNITLIGEVDYESTVMYSLSIVASDNDNIQGLEPRTTTTMVVIEITDANDHLPVCTSNLETATLEIGTHSYTYILQLSCYDEDQGLNSQLNYSFVSNSLPFLPNGTFVLNSTTGELGFTGSINNVTVVLFGILVSDSGEPPQSTMVTVSIVVRSNQTTQLLFDPANFAVAISENTPSHTVVVNGSILENALYNPTGVAVQYFLVPNPAYANTFIIDSTNGDIVLTSTDLVDFDEGQQEYLLVVEASVESSVASAVVNITLTDYNDNTPSFLEAVYAGAVQENRPAGTSILQVNANDLDSGTNGEFLYRISGTTAFSIEPISGEISTVRPLNREATPIFSFFVVAEDLGNPPLTGSALVSVTVEDQNDNSPEFVEDVYTIGINNLSPAGTDLLTFAVEDQDLVGSLSFELLFTDARAPGLFGIDSPNGILRQIATITPENFAPLYSFTVVVSDGVGNDTATVVIYVVLATSTTVAFAENLDDQVFDIQEFLLEQDFNITSNATYTLVSGDTGEDFTIDSGGILATQNQLDRESTSNYTLDIEITDPVTLETINLTIVVVVLDQNDHPPIFSNATYRFSFAEGIFMTSTPIGRVTATDADQPTTANSQIQYSLIQAPSMFNINQLSGEISVIGTVDREATAEYQFGVRARDFGSPPQEAYSDIFLSIEDINDNDPVFVPFGVISFIVRVTAGVQAGAELNDITAVLPGGFEEQLSAFEYSDPDSTSQVTATLRLVSGSNKFQLQNVDDNFHIQVLVTNSTITEGDNETVLQIVLQDEPSTAELRPVIKTVAIHVSSSPTSIPSTEPTPSITSQPTDASTTATTTATTTGPTSTNATAAPTEDPLLSPTSAGLISAVVILAAIVAVCCVISCCLYCYVRRKKKYSVTDHGTHYHRGSPHSCHSSTSGSSGTIEKQRPDISESESSGDEDPPPPPLLLPFSLSQPVGNLRNGVPKLTSWLPNRFDSSLTSNDGIGMQMVVTASQGDDYPEPPAIAASMPELGTTLMAPEEGFTQL